jgi:hypothetical protein
MKWTGHIVTKVCGEENLPSEGGLCILIIKEI